MARSYWAESVKDEIIKKYLDKDLKYSKRKLVQEFHIGNRTLNQIFRERGIVDKTKSQSLKKYDINEHYFDSIMTERAAYWLGLFYADGSIRSKKYGITLGLIEPDLYLLEEFKNEIGYTGPIWLKKPEKTTHTPFHILRISSPIMHAALNKLGCIPNKSLKLKFPTKNQVPKDLIKHFIRGYFDGDGTIGIYKDRRCDAYNINIKIVSSKIFCIELKKRLMKEIQLKASISQESRGSILSANLHITGYKKCAQFLEWIYEDASIYMKRKYNKYIEILEYIKYQGEKRERKINS